MSKKEKEPEVKCLLFMSKYPMNRINPDNKEILYKGPLTDVPEELKEHLSAPNVIQKKGAKYVIIFRDK